MKSNRRTFISRSVAGLVGLSGVPLLTRTPFVRLIQNDQAAPPHTGRMGEPTDLPTPDPKSILEHNQEKIQSDVEHLYELATELRDQVKKSNSTDVLSLDLLKKAEEVEKLAHQIRSLAKG
jgi:hypothetical protein